MKGKVLKKHIKSTVFCVRREIIRFAYSCHLYKKNRRKIKQQNKVACFLQGMWGNGVKEIWHGVTLL